MMAIASAIAGGVSLHGDRTTRELVLLKIQLTATDLQLPCSLLNQVQQLADRDLLGALQTMRQIVDALKAAVAAATTPAPTGNTLKIPIHSIPITKTIPAVTLPRPLFPDDMVRLGQRLTRLEGALAKRPAALAAGPALQRMHLSLDRGAMLAPPKIASGITLTSTPRQ